MRSKYLLSLSCQAGVGFVLLFGCLDPAAGQIPAAAELSAPAQANMAMPDRPPVAGRAGVLPPAVQPQQSVDLAFVVTNDRDVRLGGDIQVQIIGLPDQLKKPGFDMSSLRLFLSGRQITDSRADLLDPNNGVVEFPLKRTSADRAAWDAILGSPTLDGLKENTVIGVGLNSGSEYPYSGRFPTTTFIVFKEPAIWIVSLAILALVGAAIYLAVSTNIVRDPIPPGVSLPEGSRPTYSLARCQIGLWLVLVTSAYLFIWCATGDYNGIMTADALALLGISGATGLVSVGIDASKQPPPQLGPHVGFWKDILTDKNGVTWYRFQNVIWTLILGAIFVIGVWQSFELPTFDTKLLTLIGISNGLYAGFKWPEQQN